jgi:hypothetical protein
MLKIPSKNLILVLSVVWLIAGLNILHIGQTVFSGSWDVDMDLATLAVCTAFAIMFVKVSNKHIKRIRAVSEERMYIHMFLDGKAWILMAVMVTLGIVVRLSGVLPDFAIAAFYTGLGSALTLTAVIVFLQFIKERSVSSAD